MQNAEIIITGTTTLDKVEVLEALPEAEVEISRDSSVDGTSGHPCRTRNDHSHRDTRRTVEGQTERSLRK
jgi:hypothetical protein